MFPYTSPKRILLIEPPFYRFFRYERWFYPITLTLLGTYLEKLGHYVRIYDADRPSKECRPLSRIEVGQHYPLYEQALEDRYHPIWQETMDTVKAFEPEVVGITSVTAKIDSANTIAGMIKEIYGAKVTIVLGGPHVQGMRSMDAGYDFGKDYDEVVAQVSKLIDQKPNKRLILGHEQYSPKDISSVMTESGCASSCAFCCHSFENTYVYRQINSIGQELGEIRSAYGNKTPVSIINDCIMTKSKRFFKISDILEQFDLKYVGGSRIMAMSQEKIDRFIQSGGIHINVGVESGSQEVLNRVKKKLKIKEIIKRTRWLNERGLSWSAFVIAGFPFETIDDLKLTEELMHTILPTFVSINRFTPYPGTELYKEFFLSRPIRFLDLFQLNANSCVTLNSENEQYIEHLFTTFEKYNKENMSKNCFQKKELN